MYQFNKFQLMLLKRDYICNVITFFERAPMLLVRVCVRDAHRFFSFSFFIFWILINGAETNDDDQWPGRACKDERTLNIDQFGWTKFLYLFFFLLLLKTVLRNRFYLDVRSHFWQIEDISKSSERGKKNWQRVWPQGLTIIGLPMN